MITYDWQSFFDSWNKELKEAEQYLVEFRGWDTAQCPVGIHKNAGATQQQLDSLSEGIGLTLPLSYCSFLSFTNGCSMSGYEIELLFDTDTVAPFRDQNEEWIDAFIEPRQDDPLPTVSDKDYFVYGENQQPCYLRVEYLENAIQISPRSWEFEGHVFLLIPDVITSEGEWEAWFFSNDIAGARRYVSFYEMLLAERKIFNTFVTDYYKEITNM